MSANSPLHELGIHREMAGLDINKVQKEFDVVFDFIYNKNHNPQESISWELYCRLYRAGDQSLEELSKLIHSISQPVPTRIILNSGEVSNLRRLSEPLFDALVYLDQTDEVKTKPKDG